MSCGVADDDDRLPLHRRPVNRQCGKCRDAPARTVYQPNVSLCAACFQLNFVNKFKTAVRRKCALQQRRVLVAASGGLSSTTLCHALALVTGQSVDADITRGRIALQFDVVHIDDAPYRSDRADDDDVIRALQALCAKCNARFSVIPLSNVNANIDDTDRIGAALEVAPSLHALFIRHIIAQHARAHKYADVLFGTNATTSAVDIMTAVARGRGEDIAALARHTADMFGVRCHYPLRDVLVRHIAYYAHWNALNVPTAAFHPLNARDRHATVESATANFIVRLDGLYGSTVHNIISTTHKLRQNQHNAAAAACSLCSNGIDSTDQYCGGCRRVYDAVIRAGLLPASIMHFQQKQVDQVSPADEADYATRTQPQILRRAQVERKAERDQRRLQVENDETNAMGFLT